MCRDIYARLCREGLTLTHYLPGDDFFGHDGEASIDGIHPTDLGFIRAADLLEPIVKQFLDS